MLALAPGVSHTFGTGADEAVLLPLTETPVSEELLGAIHARLSGKRITGAEEIVEEAVRSGGVSVFPGWEFYAPVAGADLPRDARSRSSGERKCRASQRAPDVGRGWKLFEPVWQRLPA